jgi:hypothetical protein
VDGRVDVVIFLLEKGANVELKNRIELCPLEDTRKTYKITKDPQRSKKLAEVLKILESWKSSAT